MSKKPETKKDLIEENVMDKIHKGELHMRPKSYYVLLTVLGIISVIFLVVFATYFTSILTLWSRIQFAQGPAFGAKRNLVSLLGSFPWWSLLLGVVSLIGIIFITKRSGRLYKLRLIYSIPLAIIIIFALGFAFSYSSLPNMLNRKGNDNCPSQYVDCGSNSKGYQNNKLVK